MSGIHGAIVAFDCWLLEGGGGTLWAAWAVIKLPTGVYTLWTTTDRSAVHALLFPVASAVHPHGMAVEVDHPDWEQWGDEWSLEGAARKIVARKVRAAIGGVEGWSQIYGGPLRVVVTDDSGRFLDEAPAEPVPSTGATIPEARFDSGSFRERRLRKLAAKKASRDRATAAEAVAASGKVEVRVHHSPNLRNLSGVPVEGIVADGRRNWRVAGFIKSNNPRYAVVEIDLADAGNLSDNPVAWVFENDICIGVSGARTESDNVHQPN